MSRVGTWWRGCRGRSRFTRTKSATHSKSPSTPSSAPCAWRWSALRRSTPPISVDELCSFFNVKLSPGFGKDSNVEMSDDDIMKALQMQAALAEAEAEREARDAERKSKAEEKVHGKKTSSDRRKKNSSGVETVKMATKVTAKGGVDPLVTFLEACELGDADGKGSPILHTYTSKNEWFELKIDGVVIGKYRGDKGDCLLAIRRYYHRTANDATGLTFVRWQAKKGERLVVISTELRAMQGLQAGVRL